MPGILPPNFKGFINPNAPKPPASGKLEIPVDFPKNARVVTRDGFLPINAKIAKGTHATWIFAPNSSWVPLLQWVGNWNRAWNVLTGFLTAAHNASSNNHLKIRFPESKIINGKWFAKKGYDAKKKGLYFFVEFY
jgi:hypothetical protein